MRIAASSTAGSRPPARERDEHALARPAPSPALLPAKRGSFRPPSPERAVGDDADVDAGQLAHHAREQRAAEDLDAAPLVGRADEDVGRAALVGDAATVSTRSSPSSSRKWMPSTRRAAAAQRAASPPPRSARSRASAPRARRSRRPSRCAERQARRMIRCDFGCGSTSASTRSATACWLSGSSSAGRRRASTSSASSRSASSRSAPRLSSRKKFCSATSARSGL